MLNEIKAQEGAVAFLEKVLEKGMFAHAYIFAGPSGVGKRTTAVGFAAAVCCTDANEKLGCGGCLNCRRIQNGNYANLKVVEPSGGKTIKIDQIREVQSFLKFKPDNEDYRFIIVDKAHNMTAEASNSLLKMLEEPPAKTCFILITENLSSMLPTVVSRSQVINFNRLPRAVVREILNAEGFESERASGVIPLSRGSAGEAFELIQQEEVQTWRRHIISSISALPVSTAEILEQAKKISSEFDVAMFLEITLSYYRDILVWKLTGREDVVINTDFLSLIKENGSDENSSLLSNFQAVTWSQRAVRDNANAQLVLENLLLELNQK